VVVIGGGTEALLSISLRIRSGFVIDRLTISQMKYGAMHQQALIYISDFARVDGGHWLYDCPSRD
jgi:hypothetical protein